MTKYTAMLIRKMPAQMHRRLKAEARRKDTTMSKVVLAALDKYLNPAEMPENPARRLDDA